MTSRAARGFVRGTRGTASKRLTISPPRKRSALLGGTSLVGGVLAATFLSVAPAAAIIPVCDQPTPNNWICHGTDSSPEAFVATDMFTFQLGNPALSPPQSDPFVQATNFSPAAFGISTSGSAENGMVEIFAGSSIKNEDGIGLNLVGVGNVTVTNFGHIQGGNGANAAGIAINGAVVAEVDNHSYLSVLGTDGLNIGPAAQAIVTNPGGLYAGLSSDGVDIHDISGNGSGLDAGDKAVDVDNTQGGVIAGSQNGIRIDNVFGDKSIGEDSEAADVFIDNSAFYDSVTKLWTPGGLVAGVNADGIHVTNLATEDGISGDLTIENQFTRQTSINLTALDPLVYNAGGPGTGLLFGELPNSDGFTNGIFGSENGIYGNHIGGNVYVNNEDGQIAGRNEDGINFSQVGGRVTIDNGLGSVFNPATDTWTDVGGGTIWGSEDGIRISDVAGGPYDFIDAVQIYNQYGKIFGREQGISISGVGSVDIIGSRSVRIENQGGLIEGYWDNAVSVDYADKVGVFNGGGNSKDLGAQRGDIISADTAIGITNAYSAFVENDFGGAIVGDGSDYQPVIYFNGIYSTAFVVSDGLMTSQNNPNFTRGFSDPAVNTFPAYTLNTDQIFADARDFADFAASGGTAGSIANLDSYGQTASDSLIQSGYFDYSETGNAFVLNGPHGVMFGRIDLFGYPYDSGEFGGNVVANFGYWGTTNSSESESFIPSPLAGNVAGDGKGGGGFYNFGVIQTAFANADHSRNYTSFYGDFYNGGLVPSYDSIANQAYYAFLYDGYYPPSEDGARVGRAGLLSMITGVAGDETDIFGAFFGQTEDGYRSYLAVDAFLDKPVTQGGNPISDELWVGYASGTTGIIINPLGPSGLNQEGIPVVFIDGPEPGDCINVACQDGNTFFVSEKSPGYIQVNGIGAIQYGLYAWYLTEREGDKDPYVLVSTYAPSAYETPAFTTGAQNVFYDHTGVVEDHIYGLQLAPGGGAGGGGADLALGTTAGSNNKTGLWAKASGSWSSQNTQATDSILGTFDTSFRQNTYTVLGGGDISPDQQGDGLRAGFFGGITGSTAKFSNYGVSAEYTGGVVGGYGAFTNNGFYVDAQLDIDFLNGTYHVPIGPGFNAKADVNSVGVLANMGKRYNLGRGFIEPIVSVTYVNTHVSSFASGTSTVDFSNGKSFRAGVGGRIGTSFKGPGAYDTEVSVLAKIWDEFSGDNKVTISDGINTTTFTDDTSGVFGELAARGTIYSPDHTMSTFLGGGATFKADATTWNAKIGIRKTF